MFARLPDHGAYGAARLVLIAYGALVIGLVDNLLRPFQIGIDTRLPDYVVLLSTLGGIAIFGLNGLVFGPVIACSSSPGNFCERKSTASVIRKIVVCVRPMGTKPTNLGECPHQQPSVAFRAARSKWRLAGRLKLSAALSLHGSHSRLCCSL